MLANVIEGSDMKIAVVGAAGRMGQMLVRRIAHTEGVSGRRQRIAQQQRHRARCRRGRRASEANKVKISGDSAAAIAAANVVIDFTVPAATVAHAAVAADKGVAMVIGTTGLDPGPDRPHPRGGKKVPIMWAANMALGVNILLALVEKTASMLDPSYDIEVMEMHHRHKIDAPLAHGFGARPRRRRRAPGPASRRFGARAAMATGARPAGEIGFATLRGGEEVGVHTVMFAAAGERLETQSSRLQPRTTCCRRSARRPVARRQSPASTA